MLAKYGKGDPNASWQVLATCISTQKSVPKDKLVEALRSLTEKPAISKALKEYYLSWTATIDVLLSSDVNSPASPARVAMAESSLDRSRKTLELEIELD